ncbi:uncharacterized protein G2W53_039514 [Senna tora]|uniref:Uncharacterized protein n=1 Tax=Senna tora TaxID=362788 RepID=A0A834SMS3_9FABA|nr:uncharacterized protein G2W53_039514 [Senna tora]
MRSRAPLQTFHAITSPIRALNPIRFSNTMRSDRDDLRHLPCDEVSQSRIKSARVPKYSAKRLTFHAITSLIRALKPLGFPNTTRSDRHDLTNLPSDHEPHSSFKSTQIPKYNAMQSNVFIQDLKHLSCEHEPHPRNKTTRIPKYNAKRSIFNAIMSPIRALNPLGFPNTMRRRSA